MAPKKAAKAAPKAAEKAADKAAPKAAPKAADKAAKKLVKAAQEAERQAAVDAMLNPECSEEESEEEGPQPKAAAKGEAFRPAARQTAAQRAEEKEAEQRMREEAAQRRQEKLAERAAERAEKAPGKKDLSALLEKVAREGEGKLSNKERRLYAKHLEKQKELAEEEEAAAAKATLGEEAARLEEELQSFVVSLPDGMDPAKGAVDLHLERFSISAGGQRLFDDASLKLAKGRRYGLLGPNGMGKTTLLKHLAARRLPVPERWTVTLVQQEASATELPVVDEVLSADTKRRQLLVSEARLLEKLESFGEGEEAEELQKLCDELSAVCDELEATGADAAEARVRKILCGLGFTNEMIDGPVNVLSGGWRMRVSLAKALFLEPDLLLLDEPTNHLDLDAVLWLDDYLREYPKTLLVVSHDADFLDSVCTNILHLEERKLIPYSGGYSDFKKGHAARVREREKEFKKQQEEKKAGKKQHPDEAPYVFLVSMEQRLDADELFGPEDSDDDVLVEEDPGHQNEAASVLGALGVHVRDARDVESRVVDSCDAKLQLPSKMAELTKVDRQIEGLLKSAEKREDSIPALQHALENREALQKEVLDLEERVASAAISDRPQESRKMWQKLKPPTLTGMDLEEQSALEKAVAAAYAAVEHVGRSSSSSSSGLQRAASGQIQQRPNAQNAPEKRKQSQGPPGAAARTAPQLPLADTQPRDKKAFDWDAVEPKEEEGNRAEIPAVVSLPRGQIDVNRLKPRAAQTHSVWKENNPAEWQAMQKQGELVSPNENLLRKRIPGAKRKNDAAPAEAKKARRDDVNESVYQRRQERFNPGKSASVSLVPKQQLDESGVAVCKPDPESKARAAGMQEDIQVCEGLRSPKWLWQALYPYQQRCVQWLWGLHRDKMGGILADEMGLGKTVQIIAYLAVLHHSGVLQNMKVQNTSLGAASAPSTGGVLIVCPATLISQWRNEIHLWYPPLRVCVMHQLNEEDRKESIKQASSHQGVLITSYETMRIAIDALLEATWVLVILDEGQKIRNPHASITIACKRFSTAHRILLSGSPIQNNLQELWSLFDFVCPGRLGTLPVFTEEFAQPIENGNLMGATEVKIAAAYQCALALRELTEPCILRRTKAECMDVLKLPTKQEQVLFCHLTAEQYHLYVQFLETEQARRAKAASTDRKALGAVFFALSVLRKLCNHPDLLLNSHEDKDENGEELWSFQKSGKMKVLAEILKLWHRDGHRVLIFVQTVQMLEILELWMSRVGYTHSRIDGKTPVKRRLKLIEDFNEKNDLFAMLLTTRVGGVGLNIIGADRVLIFDPDWNPMTDVQARERAWRIGQKKEVSVYRLVLTGTVEEKIYHRQVYKHFLAQKVLQDPRQRRFFKWNDISDLFEVPPPPPNVTKMDVLALKKKYQSAFGKLDKFGDVGEFEVETTEIMKAVSDLPMKEQHNTSKSTKDESNAILQTLYDAQGIKASFNHDKVEQTLLDRKLVGQSANLVAQRALDALKRSSRERSAHHISEPTWTGQRGRAGATVKQEREEKIKMSKVPASTRTASADILQGLRQLAAIRGMAAGKEPPPSGTAPEVPKALEDSNCSGLPLELFDSDRSIAEDILKVFQDKSVAGAGHSLTTGQVLEKLAVKIASHHNDLFKSLLKQMCVLTRSKSKNSPGYWTLRKEFWPRR